MPSRGSGDATAVARTTVSPVETRAAPEACLAMRPVSKTSRLPPASSTATSCLVDIQSSFHCSLGKLLEGRRSTAVERPGRGFWQKTEWLTGDAHKRSEERRVGKG